MKISEKKLFRKGRCLVENSPSQIFYSNYLLDAALKTSYSAGCLAQSFQEGENIDIVFLSVLLDQGQIHKRLARNRLTSLCFREEKVQSVYLKN